MAGRYRKNLRLPGYDYSSPVCYVVTIRANSRFHWFGCVTNGGVIHNDAGKKVTEVWHEIPTRFPTVGLDEMILMPDHLHGIIILGYNPQADRSKAPKLGRVIQAFKSITTNQYIVGVKSQQWPRFDQHLWQPRYYEHILRSDSDRELDRHRDYIAGNPARWMMKMNGQG